MIYFSALAPAFGLCELLVLAYLRHADAYLGPSQTIKTHHNVGGLPEVMKLKLIGVYIVVVIIHLQLGTWRSSCNSNFCFVRAMLTLKHQSH